MIQIPFNFVRFPPAISNVFSSPLVCNWVDILWAAITVGRRQWSHVLAFGTHSLYEITYRSCIIAANLTDGNLNNIVRSSAYDNLDPSEKGAVSYFTGLTLAKLFCEQYLDTPWMMHLEVYQNQIGSLRFNGTKRPDLVGQNLDGRWIVLEAKGRTNEFDSNAMRNAKDQTRSLRRVGGQNPHVRVASLTHFTNGELEVDWEDPESANNDAFDLKITRNDFLADYYGPFMNLVSDFGELVAGRRTPRIILRDLDITVSIEERTYNLLRERRYTQVRQLLSDFPDAAPSNAKYKQGKDGIAIELGSQWLTDTGKLRLPKTPVARD